MRGPAEVRKVIDAFNDMQHRIMAMIADRTQALAAVGHDFRTPLARLRLRADSVADPSVGLAMEQDIGEMERMIDSRLAYLSGDIDNPPEPVAPTDIAVMCATAAAEARARGQLGRTPGEDRECQDVYNREDGVSLK